MLQLPFHWYTYVGVIGDRVVVRARGPNGEPLSYEHQFKPVYYLPTSKQTGWTALDGRPLREVRMDGIRAAREWREKYVDVEGMEVFGDVPIPFQFVAEAFPSKIPYVFDQIACAFFDIEVAGERKFPDPKEANYPINVISWFIHDVMHVWGTTEYGGRYVAHQPDIVYHEFDNEEDLLMDFLGFWTEDYPDIITGWNIAGFDVPYIINRLTKLFGERVAKKLSPYNRFSERRVTLHQNEITQVDITGVACLDYLELYKKHTGSQQENYRLDTIASIELKGERKMKFEEYTNLHQLYTNNYQKFVEYNVQDTRLVKKLDAKLKFLELVCILAYDAKVNYIDTYKQVRMWDSLIYHHLREQQIAVPPHPRRGKTEQFPGGYVKIPAVGVHQWIASFDVNSLYPTLMRQWNISPDKHVSQAMLERRFLQLQAAFMETTGKKIEIQEVPIDGKPRPGYLWGDPSILSYAALRAALYCIQEVLALIREIDVDMYLTNPERITRVRPILQTLELTVSPNKQAFRIDAPGFLPNILTRLYEERVKAKAEQMASSKELKLIEAEMQRRGIA
jgi:DNA polymerase elongation subunit (family B)